MNTKVNMTMHENTLEELNRIAKDRNQTTAQVISEGIALVKWFHEQEGNLYQQENGQLFLVRQSR